MLKFSDINAFDRNAIEKACTKRAMTPGETLFKFGDAADTMYVVLKGSVEVRRPKRKEGEFEVTSILEDGSFVGETAIAGSYSRNATVVAKDPGEILVITKSSIAALKKDSPQATFSLYEAILDQVFSRFRSLSDKKDIVSFWLG